MDDDYFDDPVFDDAAFLDQVECSASVSNPQPKQQPQQQQYNEFGDDDDFGDAFDDDLDLEELVQVEQQVVNNDGNISFVSCQDDPIPPPALPEHTASYHPLNVENLRTWIYPTNYPIRGYQLNIVQKALFNNTLVALPTGLGKTFIAAVVMYNYWRWFPNSKIIFMAPTRPLVTQQIEACFTICGLPQDDTTDMSGSVSPAKRRELWKSKRVFFTTPQTVQNDLVSRSCPAENVVCIVVDEAHKATGNYAYSEVVRKLSNKHQEFRVLALTATPGKDMDVVQNVVDNLKITNIQIRTEDSMDIRQFTHGKNVEKVIVPLNYTEGSSGMLPSVIYDFKTKIFQPMLNQLARKPSGLQISDADRVATYALTASRARFNATAHNLNNGFKFQIMSMYLVCEQMSRAFDMLRQHGIAPFVESIENTRQELEETIASGKKMNSMQSQYYNNPAIKKLLTDLKREMIKPDFIGHPKIDQLVATLLKHFVNLPEGTSSKVMIFSSFRSSVSEICRVLNKHSPMVRASFFVGQSESKNGVKGLKQYEQQEVIQKFKRDEFNVLVSTSIGEEGLDIGEIDLIICYDSQTSPIRMLQRMGRTGRKRQGKCIMLMTESEERKFAQAKDSYNRIQRMISQGTYLTYYQPNPTIIPHNYKPTISRQVLDIGEYVQRELKKRKRAVGADTNLDFTPSGLLNENAEQVFVSSFNTDLDTFTNLKQVMDHYWPARSGLHSLKKFVPLQSQPKPTYRVKHSKRTLQFTSIVAKLEHRILYPDEEIKFDLPKQQQTKLMMPTKVGGGSNALIMPKRINSRKKNNQRATEAALDDAFKEFLDQNDMSQFVDQHALNDIGGNEYNNSDGAVEEDEDFADTRKKVDNFFAPRKPTPSTSASSSKKSIVKPNASTSTKAPKKSSKQKDSEVPIKSKQQHIESITKSPVRNRDKGKGKMTAAAIDDSFEEMMDDDWQPMLPESLFEQVTPFEDRISATTTTELKIKKKWKQNKPPPVAPLDDDMMAFDSDKEPIIKKEPIVGPKKRRLIGKDVDEEEHEFDMIDDIPAEDLFMAETEALIVKGFDDSLDPVFPFENMDVKREDFTSVALIWTQTKPKFSKKGLELLDKRQNDLHELGGKFVAMSIYTKYTNSSSSSIKPVNMQSNSIITSQKALLPFSLPTSRPPSSPPSLPPSLSASRTPSLPASRPASPSISKPPSLPPSISASPEIQKQQQQPQIPVEIFDVDAEEDDIFGTEDNFFNNAAGLENDLQEQQRLHKEDDDMISIHNSDMSDDGEGGFGDFDLSDMTFAQYFENKAGDEEDQGGGFPDFALNEQLEEVVEKSIYVDQMKKKASLYSEKPAPSLSKKNASGLLSKKSAAPPTNKKSVYKSPSSLRLNQFDAQEMIYDINADDLSEITNDRPPAEERKSISPYHNKLSPVRRSHPINISTSPIPGDDDKSGIPISETTPQRNTTPTYSMDDSPIALRKKKGKNPIISENEESPNRSYTSPTKLVQMAKGLYPPPSPLANSPLRHSPLGKLPSRNLSPLGVSPFRRSNNSPLRRNSPNNASESDESPLMPVRRKRRVIEVSPNSPNKTDEGVDVIIPGTRPKKRLKRKTSRQSTSENSIVIEDDDDEELIIEPPSNTAFLQKLKQSGGSSKGRSHSKQHKKKLGMHDLIENPFVDMEAEESSDEGHSGDDDDQDDNDGENLNSFIVDDESGLDAGSRGSIEEEEDTADGEGGHKKKKNVNIYMQSLLNNDVGVSHSNKHWLNRFDENKWLNANQEDDSLIDEEDEEEEETEDSIQDFTSNFDLTNNELYGQQNPIVQDDDDDFV